GRDGGRIDHRGGSLRVVPAGRRGTAGIGGWARRRCGRRGLRGDGGRTGPTEAFLTETFTNGHDRRVLGVALRDLTVTPRPFGYLHGSRKVGARPGRRQAPPRVCGPS